MRVLDRLVWCHSSITTRDCSHSLWVSAELCRIQGLLHSEWDHNLFHLLDLAISLSVRASSYSPQLWGAEIDKKSEIILNIYLSTNALTFRSSFSKMCLSKLLILSLIASIMSPLFISLVSSIFVLLPPEPPAVAATPLPTPTSSSIFILYLTSTFPWLFLLLPVDYYAVDPAIALD